MKYKLTFALVASLTGTAFAGFQAPLPEFKNEKQLAEWRAEKASETTSQGYAAEETAFYTGKPYLASSGSYVFKYRSYNPEVARWTSEDPSGFPDGSNPNFYAPCPTGSCDPDGLAKITINFTGSAFYNGTGFLPLDPTRGGSLTYETNADSTHLVGSTSAWGSLKIGTWSDARKDGQSATFTEGVIEIWQQGTVTGGTQPTPKRDYFDWRVSLLLTTVTKSGPHTVTDYRTDYIAAGRVDLNPYE